LCDDEWSNDSDIGCMADDELLALSAMEALLLLLAMLRPEDR